jgi:membrane fusion protein (multidrug efflux system)
MSKPTWTTGAIAWLLALGLLAGCQQTGDSGSAGKATPKPAGASAPGTPAPGATNAALPGQATATVSVHVVGRQEVTLEQTFTAQVLAAKQVEVRSRIQGNLESYSFREGSMVAAGQMLFSIDPRPLQAAVRSAEAQVANARADLEFARTKVNYKKALADQAQAEANLENQQREVDRYKPLVERSIIPRQTYDLTVSARDVAKAQLDAAIADTENTRLRDINSIATAEANLEAALAALENARLNLNYTTISAPISGIIGELNVYPGNLVNPGTDVLATISSVDPIYVEFAISEADYLTLARRREETGKSQSDRIYQLLLADGKPYSHLGRFEMVDRAVDSQTGTIKVRLEFPNPGGLLKPGEFANVRLNTTDLPNALLIPQRAVQQLQSSNFVYLVNADNQVEQREIELGERFHNDVVVTKGLTTGDRVVVDGAARIKPGMTVSTEEAK